MSLRDAARAIRRAAGEEARAHAPRPERFEVVSTAPLQLHGVDTDVLLHEDDEDVNVHAPVADANLSPGDLVMVQPTPEEDGSGVAGWNATHVASTGGGLMLGGVYTLASLPAAGRNYEIVLVSNATVGQRWRGWDGTAWRVLG